MKAIRQKYITSVDKDYTSQLLKEVNSELNIFETEKYLKIKAAMIFDVILFALVVLGAVTTLGLCL